MKRDEYTQSMWEKLPDAIKEAQTLAKTQDQWWHDSRLTGGWRLSWAGYTDLSEQLKLETWNFEFLTKDIASWMYLRLKHNITTPYYIVQNRKHTRLTVFDSKIAVVINLYGNIEKFLSNLDV